ncbi:MAG: cytochrome P450 [bacterium]|nr:cytochrome P450 [bacterium]
MLPLISKPRDTFFMGDLPTLSHDMLQYLLDVSKHGDFVKAMFGPYAMYFLNHPDLLHKVLVEDADQYEKTIMIKQVLGPVIGTGLFTNDGDFWKRQRKLMQPAFHSKRIAAYADTMVDYAAHLADGWENGETLMFDQAMTNLTMHIVVKALFGLEMGADADEIGATVKKLLEIVDVRFNRLMPLPDWMPTKENRDLRKHIARLDALIQGFIEERRRTGKDNGDLLSMILLAQDEDGGAMTDKQVRDEAMTIFGAGHETTAVALTWTFYLLSQNPEVEARLHDELSAVLGGRLPTFADLPNLKYTEMIVKEAMRLYPPAFATTRLAREGTVLEGVRLPKMANVLVNIYGVHHDERFFPDPERFDPERFSPENEKTITRYAYLPFGAGPRVCIGNQFAMMEAKLIVATLAQRFQMHLAPGHLVQPERMFTLRPKYGMKMVVTERQAVLA